MTRYAQRDGGGVLIAHYSHPVRGVAEEAIADDDPEIVAWNNVSRRNAATELDSAQDRLTALEEDVEVLKARPETPR